MNAKMVVAVAVAFGVAAGAYILIRPPAYRAEARVLVESTIDPTLDGVSGDATARALTPDMNIETQIAKSRSIAALARKELEAKKIALGGASDVELLAPLTVETVRDTTVLEFIYEDPSPQRAADLANAFADAYLESRAEQVEDEIKGVIGPIDERLDQLREDFAAYRTNAVQLDTATERALALAHANATAEQITGLAANKRELEFVVLTSDGGREVALAIAPERPAGPSITFAVLFGMSVGALLGSSIAFTRKPVADRVTGPDEPGEE